jgi:hypothetical protein
MSGCHFLFPQLEDYDRKSQLYNYQNTLRLFWCIIYDNPASLKPTTATRKIWEIMIHSRSITSPPECKRLIWALRGWDPFTVLTATDTNSTLISIALYSSLFRLQLLADTRHAWCTLPSPVRDFSFCCWKPRLFHSSSQLYPPEPRNLWRERPYCSQCLQ